LKKICACAAAALATARVSYWSLVDNHSAIICELLHLRDQPEAPDTTRGARLGLGDCPAYFEALATRRPIVANRALSHPATRGLADKYLQPLAISSMLDAPVWVRGEVVGVLCHEHIGPARDWSAEEIDFVSALAAMVSLALEESDRARSERRLRESEEKFRALFEATSQGVLLHDEEKFMEINPAGVRIMGFESADEIIGKHPGETSAPIQPNGERADTLARKYIQECMTRGSARFDWVTRSPRGVEVPIEVVLTRITLGDRQLIQAVFNDITERKRAETALRESEQRLRESEARFSTAFHASPVLITISTLNDARFIEANDAFMQWIGLSREKIVGRTSQDLDLWLDQNERLNFLADLQQTRSVRNVECRLRSQRNTFHTMLLCADIIEINREPHMLVFGLDVTERKQAEAEMLKALEREKELGQFKSNFVSMVSHEFRTPLGIIQSSAEILSDYFEQLAAGERM
jgi:PAS domain S-box-containing protein